MQRTISNILSPSTKERRFKWQSHIIVSSMHDNLRKTRIVLLP